MKRKKVVLGIAEKLEIVRTRQQGVSLCVPSHLVGPDLK